MSTSTAPHTVLVVGATGQIGRVVVSQALAAGQEVLAQTRSAARAGRSLPQDATVVEADPTDAAALRPLVNRADAVVLTHGGDVDGRDGKSFYDVVAALVEATADNPGTPIALMTSMNTSQVPARYEFIAWKRRAERLLRACGRRYTIVRPGWFDYQGAADTRIDLRQGDTVTGQRGVDRAHVAQVLLGCLTAPSGERRTVEVFSGPGAPVDDVEELLAETRADEPGAAAGALDKVLVPLEDEPSAVREDLARLRH